MAESPQGAAQLPGGQIGLLPVVPELTLHGDDTRHTGLHQFAEQGHPHIAVDQHDLAFDVGQIHIGAIFHVDKLSSEAPFGGILSALIASDGIFLMEGLQDLQGCLLHNALLNLKGLDNGGHADGVALCFQDFSSLQLLRRTADTGEADFFQQFHFPLPTNFHGANPP